MAKYLVVFDNSDIILESNSRNARKHLLNSDSSSVRIHKYDADRIYNLGALVCEAHMTDYCILVGTAFKK